MLVVVHSFLLGLLRVGVYLGDEHLLQLLLARNGQLLVLLIHPVIRSDPVSKAIVVVVILAENEIVLLLPLLLQNHLLLLACRLLMLLRSKATELKRGCEKLIVIALYLVVGVVLRLLRLVDFVALGTALLLLLLLLLLVVVVLVLGNVGSLLQVVGVGGSFAEQV